MSAIRALLIPGVLLTGLSPVSVESPERATVPSEIVFRVAIDAKRGGHVLCALYDDEDDWLSRTTFAATRDTATERVAVCRFRGVPPGLYAIASLHDEDDDGEMDTNFIGLPLEGYACSRNAQNETLFAPEWDDAVFRHRGAVTVQRANMKY